MADREMIAATLAAGLLSASNFAETKIDVTEYAVTLYEKILAGLAARATAPRPVAESEEILANTQKQIREARAKALRRELKV